MYVTTCWAYEPIDIQTRVENGRAISISINSRRNKGHISQTFSPKQAKELAFQILHEIARIEGIHERGREKEWKQAFQTAIWNQHFYKR